ncbi:hypothetical protein FA95DRAFT_1556000 [Auriscalpium vulgare]|uniref:Uncharacterized protein n=1 Tax=Auriscalpium vulgare TaxID=40419 RepID=A0ACB8S1U6_9AGAM|nr:hypothetical protein FA95DRAFT_1556000 [Auriscalpium vulgare]
MNGAVARLVASVPLIRNRLPPLCIAPQLRGDLVQAYDEAISSGRYASLALFFRTSCIASLNVVAKLGAPVYNSWEFDFPDFRHPTFRESWLI